MELLAGPRRRLSRLASGESGANSGNSATRCRIEAAPFSNPIGAMEPNPEAVDVFQRLRGLGRDG